MSGSLPTILIHENEGTHTDNGRPVNRWRLGCQGHTDQLCHINHKGTPRNLYMREKEHACLHKPLSYEIPKGRLSFWPEAQYQLRAQD